GYDAELIQNTIESERSIEHDQEEAYKTTVKKAQRSLIFAIPLFIIGMFGMHWPYADIWMWFLSTPILFLFGNTFFINAYKQLKTATFNMDFLVAMSTGVAYIYSIFAVIYNFNFAHHNTFHHVYFEASGIVISFILIGKALEQKAKFTTNSAIKNLMELQTDTVTILLEDNSSTKEIPIEAIQPNDCVLIKPGDRVPIDGIVEFGNAYIDESTITGEPIPTRKERGSKVLAGTLNQSGSLHVKATAIGEQTVLAQIIQMVKLAQSSKAPIQRKVDKISAIFVPTVLGIALLTFILWIIFGGHNAVEMGIKSAITVLIVACPCALGLATPTAIMVAMGKGAQDGILVKDATSLEIGQQVDTVILDKTGTITEGSPSVKDIKWMQSDNQLAKDLLYTMESQSDHPLAHAIVNHLKSEALFINNLAIENNDGKGLITSFQNKTYWVGNPQFVQENGHQLTPDQLHWLQQENAGLTVLVFGSSEAILALISIHDSIKQHSKMAIQKLQEKGIEVIMLTGDNEKAAKTVAETVGIKAFLANQLPLDKEQYVKKLQEAGKVVAMIGDGTNDSSALAQADLSVSMGKGSDIAKDVAQVTIASSDLLKIVDFITLSRLTSQTIKQNLFWAFIYNIVCIPIAAGILYPINGLQINPMWAGAAMSLSSISVLLNCLILKGKKITQ
ncbi:MAG TPA: copper-translocating P-type ATPase, partial [Taishania sp.]|nr:copper-translocating P-type ATPase [Taishania sp.]